MPEEWEEAILFLKHRHIDTFARRSRSEGQPCDSRPYDGDVLAAADLVQVEECTEQV
jgi:hypothetical protein